MAELGNAWISIIPETSKIAPGIKQALQATESSAATQGSGFGGRFAAGIGKTLKASALGVGAAAGASIGVGLSKGIGRLVAIEQAETKLAGLGHSTQAVAGVMDSALASVKGTAYGLGDAASVAAQMVASGIQPGEELTTVLSTVGDVAAIAGREMSDVGLIFGSIAARGKLQGDDMLQLMSSGIPVLQLLSQELGKTSADVSDMVSKGEIDFATFERAMRTGMGGAALEAGNTVRGAIANVGAAAGRVGAQIAEPFYNQVAPALGVATDAIDNFGTRVGPVMANVDTWITGTAIPAIRQLRDDAPGMWSAMAQSQVAQDSMQRFSSIFTVLRGAAADAAPAVGSIVSSLGRASASLGVSGWQVFLSTLESTARIADATLVPALSTVADIMEAHPGLVTAGLAAWMGFKTIPGVIGKVTDTLSPLTTGLSGLKSSLSTAAAGGRDIQKMFADQGQSIGRFDAQVRHLAYGDGSLAKMAGAYQNAAMAGGRFARSKGMVSASLSGLKSGFQGVVSFLGGPWSAGFIVAGAAVAGIANEFQKTSQYQDLMSGSSNRAAESVSRMWDAFAEGQDKTQIATANIQTMRSELSQLAATDPGALGVFSAGLKDIGGFFQGDWEGAGTRVYRAQKAAAEGADEAKASFDELGVSNEELSYAITASETSLSFWENQLRSTTNGGEAAVAQLREQREQYQSVAQTMASMSPGALTAAESIEVLADKFATAEDKAAAFQRMMLELSGVPMELEEATAQYAETIDKTTEAMQAQIDAAAGLGPAMLDAAGGLDVTNANSRALRDSLMQLGQDATTAVMAGRDIETVMSEAAPALQAMADATGLPIEKVRELAGVYGLLPEQLALAVTVDGNQAVGEILAVKTALDNVPPGASVQLQVQDVAAREALESLGFKVQVLDEATGTVRVSATTDDAMARLGEVLDQIVGIDAAHADPSVGADTSLFLNRNSEALALLGALDAEHAEPSSSLDNSQLNADADAAKGKLTGLAGERPRPVATLDNSQLIRGVDNSVSYLNTLPTERVINIYTNHWTRNMGVQHTGGMATGGRYVPAYADGDRHNGYRLPTTGPGTETTDGFLAFDHYGAPSARLDAGEWIINGRSSEKYDRELAQINAGTFPKLPGYADGGRAGVSASELLRFARGETVNGQKASRSLEGAIYAFGGINWGDCSAAISALARFAKGIAAFGGRLATGNQDEGLAALGFAPGLGNPQRDFSIGWYNDTSRWGGHTSATIAGTNVEMGGARGNGQIGGSAAGASHSQYRQHRHLKLAGSTSAARTSGTSGEGDEDTTPSYSSLRRPTSRTRETGSTDTRSETDAPTSWSEVAGVAASAFASGMVSDALGVFGIPDAPPALAAYRQWQEAQSGTGAGSTGTTAEDLEEALADAEDDLEATKRWLEASEERLDNLPADASEATRRAAQMRVESARQAVAESETAVAEAEQAYIAGPTTVHDAPSNVRGELSAAFNGKDDGISGLQEVMGQERALAVTNQAAALGEMYRGLTGQVVGRRNVDAPDVVDEEFKRLLTQMGVKKFKDGGLVVGPGTGTSDDVPILASNREFVVNADATARNRGLLEDINAGRPTPGQARGETHYHFHGPDAGDVMRQLAARELANTMQFLGG